MNIHMLTCSELPDLNVDDAILRTRLQEKGHTVTVGLWSDPPPLNNSIILIRSCWDYFEHLDKFLGCLEEMSLTNHVWNSPSIVRWNSDKSYLKYFRDKSCPIIPTYFAGDPVPDWNCEEFIVKPRVSNAGNGVVRLPGMSMHSVIEASPNFPKKVLIQPFIKEIKEVGEYSMIYICGDFSHCIHKIPGNGDFRVQHFYGGSYEMKEPDTNLRDAARKVFKNIPEDVLYARLDFIPYQGQYCLSEAELIEPWLHFTEKPDAADLLIHCLEYRYR